MAGQFVKCNQCGHVGTSQLKGSTLITVILIICYIIPGVIYMVWRRGGLGICASCGSDNVILNTVAQAQANAKQNNISSIESTADQVRCPECRELIRFDAKKCKHCGSAVTPQG